MGRRIEAWISRELESGEEIEITVDLEVHAGRRATRMEPAEETTAQVVSAKDSEGREVALTEEEEESLTSGEALYSALRWEEEASSAYEEDCGE